MMSEKKVSQKDGFLLPGERLDDLNLKGCKIIQHPEKFCFGMDAVLLSAFVKVHPSERVLDLGTGTGIIPILLDLKTAGSEYVGLEIQPESAAMARRSVAYNKQQEMVHIVTGDIKEASKLFGKASFDVVTSNPPYMNQNHGLVNPNQPKAIARHELLCTLEDVICQASVTLKEKGRFYLIHRPLRLVEIIECLTKYRLEPKRMRMVHSFVDKEPTMVMIEAIKGAGAQLRVEKPLIIYEKENCYSQEILDIYGESM